MNVDKLKNRLASLQKQHADAHERCEVAEIEKVQDKYIKDLKKKKLDLKDEIVKIEKQIEENNEAWLFRWC